ncbi:hypothetical protein V2W45_1470435 [Cenococcum geophilum]
MCDCTSLIENGAQLIMSVGTFKFAAILDVVMLATMIVSPKTLHVRNGSTSNTVATESVQLSKNMFASRLKLWTRHPDLRLRANQFILPSLRMARYPGVIFPALYYGSRYGFASILPAVTVAHIFTEYFGWSTLVIGLTYGAALTIGGCLADMAVDATAGEVLVPAGSGSATSKPVRVGNVYD